MMRALFTPRLPYPCFRGPEHTHDLDWSQGCPPPCTVPLPARSPNIYPPCKLVEAVDAHSATETTLCAISLTQSNRPLKWEITAVSVRAPWLTRLSTYDKRGRHLSGKLITKRKNLAWARKVTFNRPEPDCEFLIHPRAHGTPRLKVAARLIDDPTFQRPVPLNFFVPQPSQ